MFIKNKLCKLIKHDLKTGLLHQWKKYIVVVVLFFIACTMLQGSVKNNISVGLLTSQPTFLDTLIYVFKGMSIYIPNPGVPFQIPIIWMCLGIYLAFIVGNYPRHDLSEYGKNILLRSKSRWTWWLSKCVWNAASVLSFYAVGYATVFLFTLATGKLSLTPTSDLNLLMNQIDVTQIDRDKLIFAVVALPIISSFALSMLQMLVTFLTKQMYSYIMVACILLSSAYCFTPFLLGNHSMLLRNALVIPNGIESCVSVVVGMGIILFSVVTGHLYLKKFDIL